MLCPGYVLAEGKVAIVFATGGLGDKSFNDSAMRGMELAKERHGVEFDFAEPSAITDYQTFLMQFANTRQYDLIISIGFDQADALNEVAAQFAEQKFAIIDMVVDKPNVASYVYKEKERGFLMGVASALMTAKADIPQVNEEKVIGVIGGMKVPLIDANIAGFIAGAHYVDAEVKALHSYVGHWADPAKGKELALAMIEQGADIVWGAAGRSGLGVINAAQEKNVYTIGSDSDQGHLAPEHVLTNGMKFVDQTVLLAIKQVLDGTFEGKINVLGVQEGVLGYSSNLLPEDVMQALEDVKAKMAAGEIDIPDSLE
jgi:basic membrane protein A